MSPDDRWVQPYDDLLEFLKEHRPLWMNQAACSTVSGTWFFTPDENGSRRGENKLPGKAVCQGCPVRVECLDHAMRNNEKHGIWGGLSSRERQKLRRAR